MLPLPVTLFVTLTPSEENSLWNFCQPCTMPAETNGRKVLSAMPAASAALRASFQALRVDRIVRLGDVDQFGKSIRAASFEIGGWRRDRCQVTVRRKYVAAVIRLLGRASCAGGDFAVRARGWRSTEHRGDRAPYRQPRSHNRQAEAKPTQAQSTQAGAYSAVPSFSAFRWVLLPASADPCRL